MRRIALTPPLPATFSTTKLMPQRGPRTFTEIAQEDVAAAARTELVIRVTVLCG